MRLKFRLSIAAIVCATMLVALAAPGDAFAAEDTARRPNVVLILMDDMGYGDIGSYGVPDARTPNLDRLAREGVRLSDAYANGPNCTPTRVALITGRYQQRVGIEWPLNTGEEDRGLAVTGRSLPALLRGQGYRTALVGKWHLGLKPEFSPNAHGFDYFFGFLSGAVDYYTHRRGDGAHDLFEDDKPVEVTGYLTDEITHRAVRFIEQSGTAPFFLEIAYNAVHWPFQPPDSPPTDPSSVPRPAARNDLRLFQGPEDVPPATRRDYVRMLERVDEGIGLILEALDRGGLAKDTLVIFTSDNGGEWLSRNAPLSHRKSTLWEGGIRVPLILRWPARLPSGKTSTQVAITMDLTASILRASGLDEAIGRELDGIDIIPALQGDAPPVERKLFWRIVRPDRVQKAVRAGRWKLLMDGGHLLLFDVQEDPGERHDVAASHPEIVRMLRALIADWEREVSGTHAGPT